MRRLFLVLLVLVFNVSILGFSGTTGKIKSINTQNTQLNKKIKAIVYINSHYGFSFNLPESWRKFKIVNGKWDGITEGGTQGERVVQTGPMLYIRHPKWTKKHQRQDIPIMIFTKAQWDMLQKNKFHIGAAPIGPSELGRNNKYVFALPARYNFAYLTGFEEIEDILDNKSLHPINVK